MDLFTQLEVTQGSNWYHNAQPQQNDIDKIMDIAPFDDFVKYEWATQFSYLNEFKDLENFNFDFNLSHLDQNYFEVDQKPLNIVLPELGHCNDKAESGFVEASAKTGNGFVSFVKKEYELENQKVSLALTLPSSTSTSNSHSEGLCTIESGFVEASAKTEDGFLSFVKKENEEENQELTLPLALPNCSTSIIRNRSSSLQFDDIKKHFDVPITMAAKKMNVGVTVLKKRCRELKITRWPHRKLRSLMLLIDNLKEKGLANEVAMLEKQKNLLEKLPGMDLNDEIKKMRQTFFKANYKKRRLIALCP